MKRNIAMLAAVGLVTFSCQPKEQQTFTTQNIDSDSVFVDSVFTAKMMVDHEGGITGADGTYSIPLKDGKSLFLFGDTFTHQVTDNSREELKPAFIHNSFMLADQESGQLKPIYPVEHGKHEAIAEPKEEGHWYWPGTGYEEDGKLYVFMSDFYQKTDDPMWGFAWYATDLLVYDMNEFSLLKQERIPFSQENDVHYGHAVTRDGEYVYIYGAKSVDGHSQAHVARAKHEDIFTDWEFFNGTEWVKDPKQSQPMKGLETVEVSEQFNVVNMHGKFVLLTQQRGIGEPEIFTFTSDSPTGNWDNKVSIYKTTEQGFGKNTYAYNAMIHPQFEKDGRIYVSYNVNSLKYEEVFADASIYRPRFISVPVKKILGE
ncbi:DUF4185 domain-containing protein [Limibacter armeniacum]|uniref:DUF4185 domain-containing protein n=1 Tax=Limibacter armeniacum TaxID=466084 RepID=UPI002FE6085D